MHTKTMATLGAVLVIGALAGCGSETTTDTTATAVEQAPRADPAPVPNRGDLTADLRSANRSAGWLETITAVVETEPGRVEVRTTIVDPRGDDGSPAARQAIAVCEAAVDLLTERGAKKPYVSVMEEDGTTFVLFGHPMVPDGECGEV